MKILCVRACVRKYSLHNINIFAAVIIQQKCLNEMLKFWNPSVRERTSDYCEYCSVVFYLLHGKKIGTYRKLWWNIVFCFKRSVCEWATKFNDVLREHNLFVFLFWQRTSADYANVLLNWTNIRSVRSQTTWDMLLVRAYVTW